MAPKMSKDALLAIATKNVKVGAPVSQTCHAIAAEPISTISPEDAVVVTSQRSSPLRASIRAKTSASTPSTSQIDLGGNPPPPPRPELTTVDGCIASTYAMVDEGRRVVDFLHKLQGRVAEFERWKAIAAEAEMEKERVLSELSTLAKKHEETLTKLKTANLVEASIEELQKKVEDLRGEVGSLKTEKDCLEIEATEQYIAGYHLALAHVEGIYPEAKLALGEFGPFRELKGGKLVGSDLFTYRSRD